MSKYTIPLIGKCIGRILLLDNTKTVRLWLGLITLSYGLSPRSIGLESIINNPLLIDIWSSLFIINAIAILVGLISKFNWTTVVVEGLLGWGIWTVIAVLDYKNNGVVGPAFVYALMMIWIIVRYPTHWGRRNG